MYIYSLTYALKLTHRHIHWHIILHTHVFINIHTHILTYTHTCWHTHTDTHSYKPVLIHWYSQKLTHSHKFIYTPHILSDINTSTLTQTYTLAHISKRYIQTHLYTEHVLSLWDEERPWFRGNWGRYSDNLRSEV